MVVGNEYCREWELVITMQHFKKLYEKIEHHISQTQKKHHQKLTVSPPIFEINKKNTKLTKLGRD